MTSIGAAPPGKLSVHAAIPQSDEARLKKTALQLEGLFVQRMFAAMRDTVPTDGALAPSSAESTFTGLMDEKLSEQVPTQWSGAHSLAQALYHQLRARLTSSVEAHSVTTAGGAAAADAARSTPNALPR
jgi:flagellar protein FlgJ